MNNDNLHFEHRKRLKEKFSRLGIDAFEDHKLLELLLFYSIPRRDTNETAHKLLNRFGSFRGVLDAPEKELVKTEGVGVETARFLSLLTAVNRRYLLSAYDKKDRFDTIEKIGVYLTSLYTGITDEYVYLLLFNNKAEMLDCSCIMHGNINSVALSNRTIIEQALQKRASGVVIAHNHPSGLAIPSSNDLHLTARLEFVLDQAGIRLIDHIIVADGKFAALIHRNGIQHTDSPESNRADDFFETLTKD